jgi:hypothetical protein
MYSVCYPSSPASSVYVTPKLKLVYCSDGRELKAGVPEITSASAAVYTVSGGVPILASVKIDASWPGDAVIALIYSSRAYILRRSLKFGGNAFTAPGMMVLSGSVYKLTRVDIYEPGGGLLMSLYPKEERHPAEVEQVKVDTSDRPVHGVMFSVSEDGGAISPIISSTSAGAWFWKIKGEDVLMSVIVHQADGRYAYMTDTDINVKYGTPHIYLLSSYMPYASSASLAYPAFIDLSQIPSVLFGVFSSAAGALSNVANVVTSGLASIANAVWSAMTTVGATIASMAGEAWRWLNETRVELGPLSLSALDIASIALTVVVPWTIPFRAGVFAGRAALSALSALGLSARAASVASNVFKIGVGAGVAYAVGKLLEQLPEVEGVKVWTPVDTLWASTVTALSLLHPGLGLAATALSIIPVFSDVKVDPASLPSAQEESQLAQYGLNSVMNDICSDPASAFLPVDGCKRLATAATVPIMRIVSVSPRNGDVITSSPITVIVANDSGVEGIATVNVYVNDQPFDTASATVPGGGTASLTLRVANGKVRISLLNNGHEVDSRTYYARIGTTSYTQNNMQQLSEILPPLITLAAVSALISAVSEK